VVDDRPALAPDAVQAQLLDRLRPDVTVVQGAQSRIDAPAGTWTRPDPLAPVGAGPVFRDAMYTGLRDVAPQLLLPGVDHVPPDTVALLETTPRVIEAYMAGLNHEMSRELLWREYPADLRATPFRSFWDGGVDDIPQLSDWGTAALGSHLRGADGKAQLVLLVRGELLRRYPTTNVYAAPAAADGGGFDASAALTPMFRGSIDPDVTFLGFALSEEAALADPGWFFVFEQDAGQARFGLDEQPANGTAASADDLAWANVPVTSAGFVDVVKPLVDAVPALQSAWGSEAASMAALTLQKPVRVAIHAALILRTEESS
jgi:hypothetical protein